MSMNNPLFRLTFAHGLFLLVVCVVMFLIIYVQVPFVLVNHWDPAILKTAQQMASMPEAELKQEIILEEHNNNQTMLVGLFSATGEKIEGNIGSFPKGLPVSNKVYVVTFDSSLTDSIKLHAAAVRRSDNSIIVVARVSPVLSDVVNELRGTLFFVIFPSFLASAVVGILLSLKFTKQVSIISDTIHKIKMGKIDERLPVDTGDSTLNMLSEDLNEMLDELVRLMEELQHAGNNIAHDLRSPLTRTKMQLASWIAHPDKTLSTEDVCIRLQDDIDQMLRIVTSLLRLSEIDSRRQYSHFQTADINETIENVLDFYRPLAEEKNISISTHFPSEACLIQCDKDLIIDAIGNIIDNAIKYTPDSGSIKISVASGDRRISLTVYNSPATLSGMSLRDLQIRFCRGNSVEDQEGYGLGLSLVMAVARLHGAKFDLTEAQGGVLASLEIPKDLSNNHISHMSVAVAC